MVESTKKSTTKKSKKPVEKAKKPAAKKVEGPTKVVPKVEKAETAARSSTQAVIIAVLSTLIVCIIVVFGILLATGVIKFGNGNELVPDNGTVVGQGGQTPSKPGAVTSGEKIINNPNQRVRVDGDLVTVKDLEFYLPDEFDAGGKNSDGAYTYNLVDDDGWAQVLVFAEKSNLTPEKYLLKVSPYLDITDDNYMMNGTSWVVGENANNLAYATELDGTIYAVCYNVKLDSKATSEAMQMIPKTLYMKKNIR